MHHAQAYIDSLGGAASVAPLSPAQAATLDTCLSKDAINYLYSACVTIGDATQAIERSLYSWATVKLYYSSFYLLRSMLALSGYALIYDGTKPRSIRATAGQQPGAIAGSPRGTHQCVIKLFSLSIPTSPLLSQEIDNSSPFIWLMHKREEANYIAGRFPDPVCPDHFKKIISSGVRRAMREYISDSSYLYSFDPDHAALALPIESLKLTLAHSNLSNSANRDEDSKRFFRLLFADRAGPMQDVLSLLRA